MDAIKQNIIDVAKKINKEMILLTIWFVVVAQIFLKSNSDNYLGQLFVKDYFLYIFLGLPILLVLFRIINVYDDKNDLAGNSNNLKSWFETQMNSPKTSFLKVISIILFIAFVGWSIDSGNTGEVMFFFNIILVAVLIVGVLFLLRLFKSIIHSLEGWTGIIWRVVFFIPCMISDFFFYLMGQFTKSPFVVYVVIAIEILLILMYKYLPDLFKKMNQSAATELLKKPVLLKNETKLTTYNKLFIEKINKLPSNDLLSPTVITTTDKRFTLSMWFYIVGMSPNDFPYNEDANVFKLTNDTEKNYHPKIVYNGAKNVCKVHYSKESADVVEFKITLQKWVHFVITYDSNTIDIFINGELVKSVPRIKDSVKFTPTDNAVVGQKDGLYGGICNILYFERPLTKHEIMFNYELNEGLDPPTN